eukprot:Phypoly_transcript_15513.p1 GENE.Phypoly_transcript_15513~~Phypoly_transcript_15513.p1  ORF type:complete len:171 (+),score=24.94 Phypoly_transcript_15513:175-687(+)
MMINKIRPHPQRTFSPRSFMGDRGIHIDPLGKVRDTMFEDEKIIAPKPWKACKSPIVQRSYTWDDDSLFNEAGQEIQTILFQSYNSAYQKTLDLSASSDYLAKEVEDALEIHFPIFSASPCSSSTPITPPTRSHNPMVLDSSFTSDNDRVPEGAELGLLSVSPPPTAKLF